jgi:dephospho-CoA kinase
MRVIGITGGIGSGKSILSKLFEIMEIPVYNSDMKAKKITESSPVIKEKLIDKFGPTLYENGKLNRKLLASHIFSKEANLAFVNSVIHPEVFKDFIFWKEKYTHKVFVGIESAILFESGLNKITDINLTVSSPVELRMERVMQRDYLNETDVLNRIKNQLSDKEREALSDYTIYNNRIQALIPQVENFFSK